MMRLLLAGPRAHRQLAGDALALVQHIRARIVAPHPRAPLAAPTLPARPCVIAGAGPGTHFVLEHQMGPRACRRSISPPLRERAAVPVVPAGVGADGLVHAPNATITTSRMADMFTRFASFPL